MPSPALAISTPCFTISAISLPRLATSIVALVMRLPANTDIAPPNLSPILEKMPPSVPSPCNSVLVSLMRCCNCVSESAIAFAQSLFCCSLVRELYALATSLKAPVSSFNLSFALLLDVCMLPNALAASTLPFVTSWKSLPAAVADLPRSDRVFAACFILESKPLFSSLNRVITSFAISLYCSLNSESRALSIISAILLAAASIWNVDDMPNHPRGRMLPRAPYRVSRSTVPLC